MQPGPASSTLRKIAVKITTAIVFIAVVVLLMLWLAGVFSPKVSRRVSEAPTSRPAADARLVPVRLIRVPATEWAVGSIRAVHEASVAAKLLAKVVEVNVKAGQAVKQGDVLAKLDDADLQARQKQAEAAVASAKAARDQAKIEYDRIERLLKENSASKIEMDRADTALKSAEAELQRAEHALNEARTIFDYATIRSPMDGVIVDKKVEVGDTAKPGQVLLTLYDPQRMQLVASVRESLTHRLTVGQPIDVRVDALNRTCIGQVSEIVPEAESASRTFSVKVTGPCPPGMYSGMFGRLIIPLAEEQVLVIPRTSVHHVGQLSIVYVADAGALRRRAVQLGRTFGDQIEVLSGLRENEQIALDLPAGAKPEGA
jgi:membrane fusion protein, multidrug efflux system